VRLKRLELAGFKTFADRTSLEISERLTAIVGPNGSGKSNIFDAIRWALGEGSLRTLRGVRTEDVIFAGCERRRPLAMAEVIVTLDNSDGGLRLPATSNGDGPLPALPFAEVTVTRRGMREADSQYFINGLPCRLRDIQMMFLGTGLGGHSYALITQGEVDHLLDATPDERRMILEEAAGLARYKRRRRDAERRMTGAEQILLRVSDVLRELEAQCAQLARQAEAAQRYQGYTQELRGLELAVQVEEVRRLARAQRRIREQLEQATARRGDIDGTLRAVIEDRETVDRRTVEAGRQWEDAQRALVRLTERRSALDAERQLLAERLRGVRAHRDRLARDTERYQAEGRRLEDEEAALAEAEEALASEQARVQSQIEEAEGRLRDMDADAARAEERLEALRAAAGDLAVARARLSAEMTAAAAQEAAARDRIAAADARLAHLAGRRTAAESAREALAVEHARLSTDLEEKRGRLAALRAEQREQAEVREGLLEESRRVETEREGLRQRLRYLEEAHAQYRGYDAGAREVLLARRSDPQRLAALRGVVAEHLEVPRDLRAAIEAALGFALSALIVDSIDDVRRILADLEERAVGRLAFLPLSLAGSPDPPAAPPSVLSDPAVRGRAADLVRITGNHSAAVRALLGDALIVQDLETALRCRAAGYPGCVITLAGEGVWPRGVLTAGGQEEGAGRVVGRAEDIALLRASLAGVDHRATDHARRAESLSARLRELETAVSADEAWVARQGEVRADVARRLTLLEAEVARLGEETVSLTGEREEAHAEVAAQEALRDRLEKDVRAGDARLAETEAETHRLAAHLRDQAGSRREAAQQVTDLKVGLTELGGRRDTLRARAGDIARALAECRARRDDLAGEDQGLLADSARLEAEEEAARARWDALAKEAAGLAQTLATLDAERAALVTRKAALEEAHQDAARRAEAVAEEMHRLELRQAQVDAEAGGARRRIEEEGGRPFDQVAGDVPDGVNRDEALGRIEALRGLIAAMGAVNLLAIDEHRQVASRVDSLRTQRDDVQGAVGALRALIGHLEDVIRDRFEATYRAVNEEFSALFTRLFGGGRATLELIVVPGSDEPGIDILVQPPGKNLRSLGALSGGERVLAALSLIFAMLRVRPSPFCVFDEVEAALDDANTRKVAQVLRELAEQTQMIIITHNKATMEACDVLFGVTMEEPGVSRIVSMRLQDRYEAESQLVGE
jgi:chromosome segregation protein